MTRKPAGFGFVDFLISLAIFAGLFVHQLKENRRATAALRQKLEQQVRELPKSLPAGPKQTVELIQSTVQKYQEEGLERTKKAMEDIRSVTEVEP